MTDSTWLESLKPGDEVVMDNGWDLSVYPVQKVTSASIAVSGLRFNKKSGRSEGRGMSGVRLLRATEGMLRQVRARRLATQLDLLDWKKQDASTLEAVAALVWPSAEQKP